MASRAWAIKKKKFGIGISDFRELREGNFLYIDKTPLISEIIEAGAKVLLIPRPRREKRRHRRFSVTP